MRPHRIVTIGCVVLIILVSACHQPQHSSPLHADPYLSAPLHSSQRIRVVLYDSLNAAAVVEAQRAVIDEDREQTTLAGQVVVRFYDRSRGTQTALLTADSACIDDRTQNMIAIGNVTVHSDTSQTSLRTSILMWDQQLQRIQSDAAVSISSPTETIEGIGLQSDQYLFDYRIYKVRGIHRPTSPLQP